MKNINFLNIGSLILIVFLIVFATSIQESQEQSLYESLPKIETHYKTKTLPIAKHRLENVSYEALFQGKTSDKIKLGYHSSNSDDYSYLFSKEKVENLKIIVDTTQILIKNSDYADTQGKSHPVFIYNNSNKKQIIGFGSLLYMHLEAKNAKGEWKPVEQQDYYFCGTGIYNYILKPNHICISSVYKYSGNFKTKLRLKHLGNYSNEFEGYVNLDEFGEYDTEENAFRVFKK